MVPLLLPKQPWHVKERARLDPGSELWYWAPRGLTADPQRIRLVCLTHPTDGLFALKWDFVNFLKVFCVAGNSVPLKEATAIRDNRFHEREYIAWNRRDSALQTYSLNNSASSSHYNQELKCIWWDFMWDQSKGNIRPIISPVPWWGDNQGHSLHLSVVM